MELALSLANQYEQNKAILSRPISSLAKMRGLNAEEVYDKLIPELAKKDAGEVLRFAEVGLRYASIVDRNRLREELGVKFIIAMDMIIGAVKSGLDSTEPWIKRKAMVMHGDLIDEQAEKQRFVDAIMTEKKLEMLKESKKNLSSLEKEIVEFEERANPIFITEKFYPLVAYGQYS
jgi:hypothetical protein